MASLLKFDVLSAFLVLCLSFACAERDFNFNDSQISLLEPRDEPVVYRTNQDPYAAEVSRCHYTESEIVLSLVLKNHDWSDLSDKKKAKLLEKLSKFFAIPKEFVVMESVTKHDMYEMQKHSIRKGNNKCHNSSRRLGRVDFMIGCGPKYFSMGEPIANQIGQQMKDGSIDNISGQKFGWWIIWRKVSKSRAERNRRQIEGSGEDEYDDSYDYDGDDDEGNVDPVTEIPATTAHPHRHHHGVSKPDLTESSSNELTNHHNNNNNVDAVAANTLLSSVTNVNSSDRGDGSTNITAKGDNNNNSNNNNNHNNIDEEIVKSVSQLESVITKTIENTKHIKELPESAVDEDDVGGGGGGVGGEEGEGEEGEPPEEAAAAVDDGGRSAGEKNSDLREASTVVVVVTNDSTLEAATISPFSTLLTNSASPSPPQSPSNANSPHEASSSPPSSPLPSTSSSVVVVDSSSYPSTLSPSSSSPSSPSPSPSPSSSAAAATTQSKHDVENVAATSLATRDAADDVEETTMKATSTAATAMNPSSITVTNRSSFLQALLLFSTRIESATESLTNATTLMTITTTSSSSSQSPSSSSSSSSELSSSTAAATTATAAAPSSTNFTSDYHVKDDSEDLLQPDDHRNTSNSDVAAPTPQYSEVSDSTTHSVLTTLMASPAVLTTTTPTDSSLFAASSPAVQLPAETTTAAAPIATSTDYVEARAENSSPMIKNRLQKFAVTSGKAFRYVVPADTFHDAEDSTNLRLELTDRDGRELKPSSWLQFNAENHEIYALPLDDAVSKWQYRLTATDSGNLSVTETLEMSVQQHRGVRSVNHEIKIDVQVHEKHVPNINWQMMLIVALTTALHDDSSTHLVVREVRQTPQDPSTATFIYFNETLPTAVCPDAELKALAARLKIARLNELLSPMMSVKSISSQLIGPCLKASVDVKPKSPTHLAKNMPPMPRNQVDRVNATIGHLLVFKVPGDTFYDPNDSELRLSLRTKENRELGPRDWLQFDAKNQEFYGIPKSGDVGSEEYLLVAEDSGGLTATDALVVVVNHPPKKEFSVYFKAYFAIRHELFTADLQRKFVERLAQLFGDRSTQLTQIRSVAPLHDADGTIVNFYNTSLHKTHNRCPEEEIEATRSVYLAHDAKVRDRVKHAFGPDLNLTNIQVIPLASCHPQPNVIHHDVIPTKTEEPTLKSTFADNYMFTFIVPAVIIVVLILVASIIACCLHRRRMRGKMELGDEEERKAFRTKGIPVIFQDELDEKPEIGNKSPIILKDEKPPLLPPSYNTSNMNGENDVDEYVAPPALVVGGREARGKSPATPSYRKPPPYVSP